MHVAILSPYPQSLSATLERAGDTWTALHERVNAECLKDLGTDFVVSYGHPYILRDDVVTGFQGRLINLHISYLPWNKGADPNFWSFFDDTPKGVTIHCIDSGIDSGAILVQEELQFDGGHTLASSYSLLRSAIEALFDRTWPAIRQGAVTAVPQAGPGTYHARKDKIPFFNGLPLGWETPISVLKAMGKAYRERRDITGSPT